MATKKPLKQKLDPLLLQTFTPSVRKGDQKRMEIIAKAVDCIARSGLSTATFEEVAHSLKTRRSHVVYYFSEKEDLFEAVVTYILASAQQVTVEALQEAITPEDQLRAIVSGAFKWARSNPNQAKVFLLFHFLATLNPRFAEISDQFRNAAKERIFKILSSLPHRSETEARHLASSLQAFIIGSLIEAISSKSSKTSHALEEAAIQFCMSTSRTHEKR